MVKHNKVGRNIVESGIKHHKFNFEVSQLYIIYVYLLDTRSEVALIKKKSNFIYYPT